MKKGFTLIEVLVVVFLASIIFSALFMVMSSGRTTWYSADTQISLQQEMRKAMRQIADDMRQSGISQISIPADSTTYSSISFNVSEGAGASGVINWSSSPINFSLSGGQIIRTDGSTTRVLANNITSLGFTRQFTSPKVVRTNITAQKTSAFGGVLNATLDSAVALRN
ncbi:MAG: prepilin-type N-terminal cleavage/methylation domain-containing protein [Candidatus Omnitrophica bacterium]|nr:prepilin-type N-terminal cleavage/methylation domain-containing protein [Candidatus Omnitrophota bacterium]